MTEKQEIFLKKYLNEKYLSKLNSKGHDTISKFIGMIIETDKYLWTLLLKHSKQENIPKEERKLISEKFEKNKEILHAVEDESIHKVEKYCLPKYKKAIYYINQQWFKGMSSSPTTAWFWIDEDFNKISVYQILIDLEIYNIYSLLCYLGNINK